MDFNEPDQGFNRFALAKIISERYGEISHFMIFIKPVSEEAAGDIGSTGIALIAPFINSGAYFFYQKQVRWPPAGRLNPPSGINGGVFQQVRRRLLPRYATGDFRQFFIVRDDGFRHDHFTSTSNACEVSFPKMSITLTRIRYLPGFSYTWASDAKGNFRSLRVR